MTLYLIYSTEYASQYYKMLVYAENREQAIEMASTKYRIRGERLESCEELEEKPQIVFHDNGYY
jgi:hypothetical protein